MHITASPCGTTSSKQISTLIRACAPRGTHVEALLVQVEGEEVQAWVRLEQNRGGGAPREGQLEAARSKLESTLQKEMFESVMAVVLNSEEWYIWRPETDEALYEIREGKKPQKVQLDIMAARLGFQPHPSGWVRCTYDPIFTTSKGGRVDPGAWASRKEVRDMVLYAFQAVVNAIVPEGVAPPRWFAQITQERGLVAWVEQPEAWDCMNEPLQVRGVEMMTHTPFKVSLNRVLRFYAPDLRINKNLTLYRGRATVDHVWVPGGRKHKIEPLDMLGRVAIHSAHGVRITREEAKAMMNDGGAPSPASAHSLVQEEGEED